MKIDWRLDTILKGGRAPGKSRVLARVAARSGAFSSITQSRVQSARYSWLELDAIRSQVRNVVNLSGIPECRCVCSEPWARREEERRRHSRRNHSPRIPCTKRAAAPESPERFFYTLVRHATKDWCILQENHLRTPIMNIRDAVHSDPETMGGTPVFVGTRVPVQSLFDYIEGGETLDEFLHQFPSVTRERAITALDAARDTLLTGARTS